MINFFTCPGEEATNGVASEAQPEAVVEGGDSVAELKAKVAAEQQVLNGNGEHVNGVNGNGVAAEESSVPDVAAV